MPRYNYPITRTETKDLLAIATSSDKAAQMIVDAAEELSEGDLDYETATHPDDMKDSLLDLSEPHEEVIRAFDGTEHVPEQDIHITCDRVVVNSALKCIPETEEGESTAA